jgi:hypothetical protein
VNAGETGRHPEARLPAAVRTIPEDLDARTKDTHAQRLAHSLETLRPEPGQIICHKANTAGPDAVAGLVAPGAALTAPLPVAGPGRPQPSAPTRNQLARPR